MTKSEFRKIIISIMLPFTLAGIGISMAFLLKKVPGLNLSKLSLSLIVLVITSASVLLLLPRVFKIPFGSVSPKEFIKNLGLYKPQPLMKLVLLGIFASLFTLTGMLVGSLLTGKYIFSTGTISLAHAVFSLTPGIWEEVLFRGVIMIVLLRLTKSYKLACLIQIVIFGLGHIKGLDLLSIVDAFSVIIIAVNFTYIAYKTKSLIPGMIAHYVHDSLLFAVQLPGGDYFGFQDNMFFYASLWISIALCVFMVKLFVERFNIVSLYDLYEIPSGVKAQSTETFGSKNE